ncbi:MAG: hypothetical protein KGZ94_05950 [Clostridia bacterium]|nr:hypothetical protein [Clostridia bacterium]
MMNNSVALIKSQNFGNVQCDFWRDDSSEIWMTRDQIGKALEYKNPNDAIAIIHTRNRSRLDVFSTSFKLKGVEGNREIARDMTVYSPRGVYEICRWSRQPKADAFMDFVWDVIENLRKGKLKIVSPPGQSKITELDIKAKNAEARLRNSKARQAKLILNEVGKYSNILSVQAVELLTINAFELIAGEKTIQRPQIEQKYYSATEVAQELGTTPNKIGRLSNKYQLKQDEYGMTVLDKSPYSSKQVANFIYNEKGRKKLAEIYRTEASC